MVVGGPASTNSPSGRAPRPSKGTTAHDRPRAGVPHVRKQLRRALLPRLLYAVGTFHLLADKWLSDSVKKVGERYDTGLLSFTLPTREAKEYLAPLTPEGARMIRNAEPEPAGHRPAAGFTHLGLPEPETLVDGMLTGGFCPDNVDSPDAEHLAHCVKVFSHEYAPGTTRIHLRSTIEPGLTPPR
ncbi:hypothetical protein [Streptomyces sp. NPDC001930]|uniref:hypothetical protein n=1 Tax=Streptomyces sp. NPDC001930 TaxID=3364625 RepID=UPI0036846FD3